MLHKFCSYSLCPFIMKWDNYDFQSDKINSLIAYLKHCQKQNFFMDDPSLAEGIKKNEPDTVSKLTNSFFKDALGHISHFNSLAGKYLQSDEMRYVCGSYKVFMSVVNKESLDFFNDDGTLNKKKGLGFHEKIVITTQLILWSRISSKCYKLICVAVLQFKLREIDIGEREIWSWLHSFTTCVSCSTSSVYNMHATVMEKKHSSCQILLLSTSIQRFLDQATKRFFSLQSKMETSLQIDYLNIATSYFTHYIIQGRKVEKCISRKDLSLNYFLGNKSCVWDNLITTFSSFVEEGKNQTRCHGERMFEEDDKHTNRDLTQCAASALVLIRRSPPIPSKQETPASVPLVTEEKYLQLRRQLVKMYKQFTTCGMVDALEHESTSMEDKRKSYEESCTKFVKSVLAKETKTNCYDQYMIKLVAYSGLLINDILRVENNKDLLEYQNVFAHVLSYCLDGSYNEKKKIDWESFFAKLVPRSAFSTGDKSHVKLPLYFKKCFESMEMKAPDEKQLDFYYQQNYFPVITQIVAESNVNAVLDAIGDGGNEGKQSSGVKKTCKKTKGSLGTRCEQPTNHNPSSKKQHKAGSGLGALHHNKGVGDKEEGDVPRKRKQTNRLGQSSADMTDADWIKKLKPTTTSAMSRFDLSTLKCNMCGGNVWTENGCVGGYCVKRMVHFCVRCKFEMQTQDKRQSFVLGEGQSFEGLSYSLGGGHSFDMKKTNTLALFSHKRDVRWRNLDGSPERTQKHADGESESFRNLKAMNYKKEAGQGQTNIGTNPSTCKKQHKAKVDPRGFFESLKTNKAEAGIVVGCNKLQKKHGASPYLSPEGKGSSTERTRKSQRTSPRTEFYSP